MGIRVLTIRFGLPFNSIFPIEVQVEFHNFNRWIFSISLEISQASQPGTQNLLFPTDVVMVKIKTLCLRIKFMGKLHHAK